MSKHKIHTILTHNAALLFVKVPKDAHNIFNTDYRLFYTTWNKKLETSEMRMIFLSKDKLARFDVIGTTLRLNDDDIKQLVIGRRRLKGKVVDGPNNEWDNYNNQYSSISTEAFCTSPLESWKTMLEHNGLTKSNYIVLKHRI